MVVEMFLRYERVILFLVDNKCVIIGGMNRYFLMKLKTVVGLQVS